MAKEKVNYQEVYDLYKLCSETMDLREFCADYVVNYDKFMNWQRYQLWSEKLGKTVPKEQLKVAKVQITGKPCNSPTVKLKVKLSEGESPIKWVKLQLSSGATLLTTDMFRNEDLFRMIKLSGEQIKEKRLKLTGPILERIHHKVVMIDAGCEDYGKRTDEKGREQYDKPVEIPEEYPQGGSAEILNNLCEQRMKPVKLLLKNCMNIGSEDAAENSAFIFSLIESCKLNDIDPQDYLKHLFECIFMVRTATRRLFCHVFINRNVKTKIFSCEHFYFIG